MPFIQVKGKIISFETIGNGNKQRLIALFKDETGVMELLWFKGVKYQKESLLKPMLATLFLENHPSLTAK